MPNRKSVFHIYKNTYTKKQYQYLGSTKDILSREEYFRKRGYIYQPIQTDPGDAEYHSVTRIPLQEWHKCAIVLVEMTFTPGILKIIRRLAPQALILVRSHNAELLHRLDWARSQGVSYGGLRSIVHAVKNFALDFIAANQADYILSISDWEVRNYWRFIASSKKIKYTPFFLAKNYFDKLIEPCEKKKHCIHFGAAISNPLISDSTFNFVSAVHSLHEGFDKWKFFATGDQASYSANRSPRINWTGFLKSPYEKLRECKAMAILSDKGYGFKTKILEAIASNTYVILTPKLFSRVPNELKPFCIKSDLKSKNGFLNALNEAENEFPQNDANQIMRRIAFSSLDKILP